MNRNFIEFINNKDVRILLDFNDIRAIEEGPETSKEYCKIFFYSAINTFQWVKEDYDSIILKLKNFNR
jgi:hypothetical protein